MPLVVQTTPANVPDQEQLPALLEAWPAIKGRPGRPRARPGSVYGDRAYGTAQMIAPVLTLHVLCFLAPRGLKTHGSGLGRVRYVVERTFACFSQFRRLRVCYERWHRHWQGFHDLAAGLLVATRLRAYRPIVLK